MSGTITSRERIKVQNSINFNFDSNISIAKQTIEYAYFGDNAINNSDNKLNSLSIGDNFSFIQGFNPGTMRFLKISNLLQRIENERMASVIIEAVGEVNVQGSNAYLIRYEVLDWNKDYDIIKIPNDDTIFIDNGYHYEQVRISARGNNLQDVKDFLDTYDVSDHIMITGNVFETYDKDGSVLYGQGNATFYKNLV